MIDIALQDRSRSSSRSACSSCSTSSATTRSRAGAASRCCASRSASAASCGRGAFGADRTEWALSAIPLGGYVKMLGRARRRRRAGRPAARVQPPERVASASRSSPPVRIANLLLAVLLFAGTYVAGVPGQRALLAAPPPATPAAAAGIARGRSRRRASTASRCAAGRTCAGASFARRATTASRLRSCRDDLDRERDPPRTVARRARQPTTGKATSCRRLGLRADLGAPVDRPGACRASPRSARARKPATASSRSTARRCARRRRRVADQCAARAATLTYSRAAARNGARVRQSR